MNRLKKWYLKRNPPLINTEGIWYDSNSGKYEAHYYPTKLEKARVVGRYDSLDEAILAKQVYEQAMKTIKNELKQKIGE